MQRAERWKTGAVLAGVVVIVLGACDAGEIVADAMVDAGELVSDAGEWLRDGASNDAEAQVPGTVISMEVPCDVVREQVVRTALASGGTVEVRTTRWYAELSSSDIDVTRVRSFDAFSCDWEDFGTPPPACPESGAGEVTCEGDPALPSLPCHELFGLSFDDGIARAQCGARTSLRRDDEDDGTFTDWSDQHSQRARRARLSIRVD